jgi:hypothetical protein
MFRRTGAFHRRVLWASRHLRTLSQERRRLRIPTSSSADSHLRRRLSKTLGRRSEAVILSTAVSDSLNDENRCFIEARLYQL